MLVRVRTMLLLFLLFSGLAIADDKKKSPLPAFLLQARTVLVIVNPDEGTSPSDPTANRTAQENVEKAFIKWGRLKLALDATSADLVIVVRKGNGKMVNPTISGGPVNDRPVIVETTEGGPTRVGVQRGAPPDLTSRPSRSQDTGPHLGTAVGPTEDAFQVYRGGVLNPVDGTPLWSYIGKDALRASDVPAVAAFRKAIEEAEKQQQKQKP